MENKEDSYYMYNLGIRFENIVDNKPNKTAIKFSSLYSITYYELNSKSNQLARYLLKLGVTQKDVVCISGLKQLDTFACILACLKIGAIYSILDNNSPVERLNRIISTCQPKVIFIERSFYKTLGKIINQLDL